MARPKGNRLREVATNLIFSPDVKQMLDILAADAGSSVSELVGVWTEREYKQYRRRWGNTAKDVDIPGQISLF